MPAPTIRPRHAPSQTHAAERGRHRGARAERDNRSQPSLSSSCTGKTMRFAPPRCARDINRLVPKAAGVNQVISLASNGATHTLVAAASSGRRRMREESGETTGDFRIDLERVVVDPDYRRRVLMRLRAETGASAPPMVAVPSHES